MQLWGRMVNGQTPYRFRANVDRLGNAPKTRNSEMKPLE